MPEKSTGCLVVYENGLRVDVHAYYTPFKSKGGGGVRGVVGGYSKASRLRLIKKLTSLDVAAVRRSLVVTLTYHKTKVEHVTLKSDLKSFFRAVRRNYPAYSGLWKLEPQKRGSPHYHILLFPPSRGYIPHGWIAERWNGIAEPGNRNHLEAGTEIRSAKDARSIGAYLSKYVGKPIRPSSGTDFKDIGRFWGEHNRAQLPVSKVKHIRLFGDDPRKRIESLLRDQPGAGAHCGRATRFTRTNGETREYLTSSNGANDA